MAAITLGAAYSESKDYGTGLEFSCRTFDDKASRACIIMEMKDGTGFLGKMLCIEATATGAKVTKLNGDVQVDPAGLTYTTLSAAAETGKAALAAHISAQVANVSSGT